MIISMVYTIEKANKKIMWFVIIRLLNILRPYDQSYNHGCRQNKIKTYFNIILLFLIMYMTILLSFSLHYRIGIQ